MENIDLTQQSLEYLRSLSIGYQQSQATVGLYKIQNPSAAFSSGRPKLENLPQIVVDLYNQVVAKYPDRGVELLKYRQTIGDKLIAEIDDQIPLPPEDQLIVMNVTTSIVLQGQIELTIYMLIGCWQNSASADTSLPTI